jgi:DNA-binding response OmpR family regulator
MLATMAGFDHHLAKPYDPDAVVALLDGHARRLAQGDARRPWPLAADDAAKKDGLQGS